KLLWACTRPTPVSAARHAATNSSAAARRCLPANDRSLTKRRARKRAGKGITCSFNRLERDRWQNRLPPSLRGRGHVLLIARSLGALFRLRSRIFDRPKPVPRMNEQPRMFQDVSAAQPALKGPPP